MKNKIFKFILKKFFNREFILYLILGVLTTIVDTGVFYICNKLSIHYQLSTILAWFFAVFFAYITNKIYVFKKTENSILKEILWFFSFRFLSLIVSLGAMYIFVQILYINELISKLITSVLIILVNYFFSKVLIFK